MCTRFTNELKHQSLQLLQEYQRERTAKIRNQIVKLNMGLVRKEAHHWENQCTESYEDLIQVGSKQVNQCNRKI